MDPLELMRRAVAAAERGIAAGQTPFGCAIARGDELLAETHNTVWQTFDVTAHAEVNALRAACSRERSVHLPDAIVATTCEPCPMCLAALHWARVEVVYYGAAIEDARQAGFNEMQIAAREVARLGGSRLHLEGGVLEERCRGLFAQWTAQHQGRDAY